MNSGKKSNPLIWIIPLGCFGVVALTCGGCVLLPLFGIVGALKSSQGYVQSFERVKSDPRVIAELGEPISSGMSIQGNFRTNNGKSSVEISYPISGPNGSGSVEVVGSGENGNWTFTTLTVTANEKKIDLTSEQGIVLEPDRVKAANEDNGEEATDATDADEASENTEASSDATGAETGADSGTEAGADSSEGTDAPGDASDK